MEQQQVIWFSGWFSSFSSVIKEIKEDKSFDNIKIIGSHMNDTCPYAGVVDEYCQEPRGLSAEEYINWSLDFCKKNNVKLLFARIHTLNISENIYRYNQIGVDVEIEQHNALKISRSKAETYNILSEKAKENHNNRIANLIPSHRIISSIDDFKDYSVDLVKQSKKVCIKYDSDEGGNSFRIIDDSAFTARSLRCVLSNKISLYDALNILGDFDFSKKKLLAMEYLDGPEVSVDCYTSTKLGFIAIPRYKMGDRLRQIIFDKDIIESSRVIGEYLNIGKMSPFNVQFRWDTSHNLKLLEVNTRMSGGIQMSSLSGFSIVKQVIADRLHIDIRQEEPKEHLITQYETPILVE